MPVDDGEPVAVNNGVGNAVRDALDEPEFDAVLVGEVDCVCLEGVAVSDGVVVGKGVGKAVRLGD